MRGTSGYYDYKEIVLHAYKKTKSIGEKNRELKTYDVDYGSHEKKKERKRVGK